MASKTPDPRKPLKTALELAEERAAAATKVSEVSQGLVPETAPVDPVVQGAGKMTQHVEGAPATSAAAAEAAAANELTAAQKLGRGAFNATQNKYVRAGGRIGAGLAGSMALDAADDYIPRADNSTLGGKLTNAGRDFLYDTAQGALLAGKKYGTIGGAMYGAYDVARNALSGKYSAPDAPAPGQPFSGDSTLSKIGNYMLGPRDTPAFPQGATILREATQGPVSEMNPDDLHEVVNSQVKLPPNVKQEDDGSYTKSIYDDRGNYIGYGNSRTPYAAEAEKVLKQDLGPQAQAIYERLKAGHAQNSSSKPPVMKVSPSGEVIQTNYDEDGNIVRSQNPEVQRLVDERLRDRAQQAVAAMPEFEAGHVERFNKFKESVEAERALETAKNTGVSQDPIVNGRTARIMADSAERVGKATGKDPATLIPAADPRYPNPVEDIAREILQRKAQNLGGMSQSEAVANALIAAPNQYRSPIQNEAQKNAIQAFAPAEKVSEAQALNEDRDLTRVQADRNAAASRDLTERTRLDAITAGQEKTKAILIGRQLASIQQQISKLSPNPSAAKMNAPRIAELQAQYKEMAKMDTTGIFGGEDVDSDPATRDITPQPTNAPTKESMKPGQTVVGKDGKTYKWTGTGFVPA
jgi:hypothetical protein